MAVHGTVPARPTVLFLGSISVIELFPPSKTCAKGHMVFDNFVIIPYWGAGAASSIALPGVDPERV